MGEMRCRMLKSLLIFSISIAIVACATDFDSITAHEIPSDERLLPIIGNGYIGQITTMDSLYLAGLWVGNGEIWQDFIGATKARIPAPLRVIVPNSQLSNITLHIRGAYVSMNFVTLQGTAIEVMWYCHRECRSILVAEVHIDNSAVGQSVDVPLAVNVSAPTKDILFQPQTATLPNTVAMSGILRKAEIAGADTPAVAVVSSTVPSSVQVDAHGSAVLVLCAAIRSTLDCEDALQAANDDMKQALSNPSSLFASHTAAWAQLWNSGIDMTPINDTATTLLPLHVNSTLYNLLSSVRDDWPYPAVVGGAGTDGYYGNVFWDSEMFINAALQPFYPAIAQMTSSYRAQRMNAAQQYAKSHLFSGCMFPWQSAATGHEVNMVPVNYLEQHVNGDIAWYQRQQWYYTNNITWLQNEGYPITKCIAEWWMSRMIQNPNDHSFNILNVVGPDEYGVGFPLYSGVDDSVFTNQGAVLTLLFAAEAAELLQVDADFAQKCRDYAANVTILFDELKQMHPQYKGFPAGNRWFNGEVKQADVVLLGYPVQMNMPANVRLNDLQFYEALYAPNGPDMTWSMSAVAWLELGNVSNGHDRFQKTMRNMQPPFDVWTETPDPEHHPFDLGCFNFLSGAGGWLQSIINGYAGLRVLSDRLHFMRMYLPEGISSVTLRNIQYRGNGITVSYDAVQWTVCLNTANTANKNADDIIGISGLPSGVGSSKLVVRVNGAQDQSLVLGQCVCVNITDEGVALVAV
eukprot:TRINITY_DN7490_c0_g1_i1.p1 TRINITY_DN7490_c0_g1~~TRINITY_DN7490_c0_g1_i1.p1  ORF type:complete len:745 (+),score=159.18 TRINITY_DN7490_c0_g1_i1:45-2279(+)